MVYVFCIWWRCVKFERLVVRKNVGAVNNQSLSDEYVSNVLLFCLSLYLTKHLFLVLAKWFIQHVLVDLLSTIFLMHRNNVSCN